MMSTKSSLLTRLDKHFAGASALAAAAGLAGTAQTVQAGIVYSGVVNINIPSTTQGVYLNVVTGVNNASPGLVPGWDVNPYGSGSLIMFNPAAPAGGVYVTSGTTPANLAAGTTIGAASTYGSGTCAAPPFNLNSSNNIIGFRFQNEANGNAIHYGWMRISLTATTVSQPRTIVEYAYEDAAGVAIQAGATSSGPTGACCVPSTLACVITGSTTCTTTLGGAYFGDGSTCAQANCPSPGACCKTDGTCAQTTAAACATAGGVYGGDSTSCATANCPPPGACCKPDLTCAQLTSAACQAAGGTYGGDNVTCAQANCPTPGACCKTDGSCAQTTSAACTTAGGVYHGDSSPCASANCPGGYHMDCNAQGTFTDISATGTVIPMTYPVGTTGDDATGPFTSSVTNALVTNANLFACSNGFISNLNTYTTFTNSILPVTAAGFTFALFPDWDDLYDDAPGAILHQAAVEGGVNVEIIQWNQLRTFTGGTTGPRGTFEVKIFDVGGPALVQYLYQGMAWDFNGNSSTVGVQWSATGNWQNSYGALNDPPPGPIADNSVCNILANVQGSTCYANCDLSTTLPCLNVLDFSCFLNQFAAGNTQANCDQSTTPPVLNVLDFGCFLNSFAAGCSSC